MEPDSRACHPAFRWLGSLVLHAYQRVPDSNVVSDHDDPDNLGSLAFLDAALRVYAHLRPSQRSATEVGFLDGLLGFGSVVHLHYVGDR